VSSKSILVESLLVAEKAGYAIRSIEVGDDGTSSSELSMVERIEDSVLPVYKEYRGDVKARLSEDMIEFIDTVATMPDLEDILYMDIVISYDVEEFKEEFQSVSHKYVDRELTIDTYGGSGIPLNKDFVSRSKIEPKEYTAIFGKIDEDEVVFPYVKIIDKKGNVFSFSSGKNVDINLENRKVVSYDYEGYTIGDYISAHQKSHTDITFPVDENSLNIFERYHSTFCSYFGRYNSVEHEKSVYKKINTFCEYEIDATGRVDTREAIVSPDRTITGCKATTILEESEDGELPVDVKIMSSNDGNTITKRNEIADSCSSTTQIRDKHGEFIQSNTPSSVVVKTEGDYVQESRANFIKSDRVLMTGLVQVNGGFFTKKSFMIDAESIYIRGKQGIFMETDGYLHTKSESIYMGSRSSVSIVGGDFKDEDGNTIATPALVLDRQVIVFGESVAVVGADTVAISAPNISIPGLPA